MLRHDHGEEWLEPISVEEALMRVQLIMEEIHDIQRQIADPTYRQDPDRDSWVRGAVLAMNGKLERRKILLRWVTAKNGGAAFPESPEIQLLHRVYKVLQDTEPAPGEKDDPERDEMLRRIEQLFRQRGKATLLNPSQNAD